MAQAKINIEHQAVVVAGSGRGGTTWVLDVLARANKLRPIFEPLHPAVQPVIGQYAHRFVPATENLPELAAFFSRVFSGSHRSIWSDFRVRSDRLQPSVENWLRAGAAKQSIARVRRLARNYRRFGPMRSLPGVAVKLIRANLMLGWLRNTFFVPIVMITRHPCAVIESQLRLGGSDWDPDTILARYRSDHLLQDRLSALQRSLIESARSMETKLAVVWAIENEMPQRLFGFDSFPVVRYEHLLTHPEEQWGRMITMLGLATMPAASEIKRPSEQISTDSQFSEFGKKHLSRWKSRLGGQFIDEIQKVLDTYEIETYTTSDPLPKSAVETGCPEQG